MDCSPAYLPASLPLNSSSSASVPTRSVNSVFLLCFLVSIFPCYSWLFLFLPCFYIFPVIAFQLLLSPLGSILLCLCLFALSSMFSFFYTPLLLPLSLAPLFTYSPVTVSQLLLLPCLYSTLPLPLFSSISCSLVYILPFHCILAPSPDPLSLYSPVTASFQPPFPAPLPLYSPAIVSFQLLLLFPCFYIPLPLPFHPFSPVPLPSGSPAPTTYSHGFSD